MNFASSIPTLMSAVALGLSVFSLFESTLKAPQLDLFVAPLAEYTDPDRPDAVREVVILPLTIANSGARTATVQLVGLEIENPRTKQSKRFYGARLGSWGETPPRPFAPAVLAGKATYSQTLQFEPRFGEEVPRIMDLEAGTYTLKLTLDVASAGGSKVAPLVFEMQMGKLDYRYFQGTGTMPMWTPAYRSPANVGG